MRKLTKRILLTFFTFLLVSVTVGVYVLTPGSGLNNADIQTPALAEPCDEGYDLSAPAVMGLLVSILPGMKLLYPNTNVDRAYSFYVKQTHKNEDQLIVAAIDKNPTTKSILVGIPVQANTPDDIMILGLSNENYTSFTTGSGTGISCGVTASAKILDIGVSMGLQLAYEQEKSRSNTTAVGSAIQYVCKASEFGQTSYPFKVGIFLNVTYYNVYYYVFVKGVNNDGVNAWMPKETIQVAEVSTEYFSVNVI